MKFYKIEYRDFFIKGGELKMERISVIFFGLSILPLIFIGGTAGHMLFLACLIAPFILAERSFQNEKGN